MTDSRNTASRTHKRLLKLHETQRTRFTYEGVALYTVAPIQDACCSQYIFPTGLRDFRTANKTYKKKKTTLKQKHATNQRVVTALRRITK